MESVDWKKIMSVPFRTAARKHIRTNIRAICLAGIVLLAEDVIERVSREVRGTFSFILSQPWRVKWTRLHRVLYFCQALQQDFLGKYFRGRTICAVTTDTRSGFKTSFISRWMNEGSKYKKINKKNPTWWVKLIRKQEMLYYFFTARQNVPQKLRVNCWL